MTEHVHTWLHPKSGTVLMCAECGELWPGDSLWPPPPALALEARPRGEKWGSRTRAMLEELDKEATE